jgi:uridylate kinase
MLVVVSRNFVVARHPFRKRVLGAYKARVFATGTISSFFTTNMPNPLLWVQNNMFRVVSRNFVVARHPFRKRVLGAYKAQVFATGTISSFFTTNMPNPLL